MYRLFARVESKNTSLQKAMYTYVKERGTAIVSNKDNRSKPEQFVVQVLKLRNDFQEIVEKAFGNDKAFQRKLKEAVEAFVNINNLTARYLATYTDILLRNRCNKLNEMEVQQKLDDVITVFKYLTDKDIFEEFYKQQLSNRLLLQTSSSDSNEKEMIRKLKAECGNAYTSKLDSMFNDIERSDEINAEWQTYYDNMGRHQVKGNTVEISARVLTRGHWPIKQKKQVKLPAEVVQLQDLYKMKYEDDKRNQGKVLAFQTSEGTADVQVDFYQSKENKKVVRKTIVCHTHQMCILLLFNDRIQWTWKEIYTKIGIDSVELKPRILGLYHPKVGVLKKRPMNQNIVDTDRFRLSTVIKNEKVRIVVPNFRVPEPESKTDDPVPSNVAKLREVRVNAAVVRIMKARQTLTHQHLIIEVVKQLKPRFNPNPQFIKQRIESLIEQEYLERDPKDRRVYKYVA